MTYAVFTTGGKQYRVKVGDKAKIEKLSGEYQEGDSIIFDNVLMTEEPFQLGMPKIDGAKVSATLTKIGRAKKIDVMHYKPKSRYFKQYGHRQPFFEVKIESVK